MRIEKKKLTDINPSEYNPRTISDEAYSGLKKSIEKFGLVEPIVWNEETNNIVGGHQRYKILLEKEYTETDVIVVNLNEIEEKALNLTLNNTNITGEFTNDLQDILNELEGFPEIEFEELKLSELLNDITPIIPEDNIKVNEHLQSECYIEIYCSKNDLDIFRSHLDELKLRENVTINIAT